MHCTGQENFASPSLCWGFLPSSYRPSQQVRPKWPWVPSKDAWRVKGASGPRRFPQRPVDVIGLLVPEREDASLTLTASKSEPVTWKDISCWLITLPLLASSSLIALRKSETTESPKWPYRGKGSSSAIKTIFFNPTSHGFCFSCLFYVRSFALGKTFTHVCGKTTELDSQTWTWGLLSYCWRALVSQS